MQKLLQIYGFIMICLLSGCTSLPDHAIRVSETPDIYPDYCDITIPSNIAPLNFMIRNDSVSSFFVTVKSANDSIVFKSKSQKMIFPTDKWKKMMSLHESDTLQVTITARKDKQWIQYPPFYWNVVSDKIDPYLSYRLIEPGYEVWNRLQLKERCLEDFNEKTLADNKLLDGKCMNCHVYGNNSGDLSMFHLRGKNGGTVLNQNGSLRKLSLKNDSMVSSAVYGSFHPSGKYGVFSTNIIVPEFHTQGNKRLEVYDTKSDLVIADFENNQMITSPLTSDSLSLQTFPVFSADGNYIYYCTAPLVDLPDSIHSLRYSLCRIPFDATKGEWGTQVDTLWDASLQNASVCHPKTSPDGRYILYTVAEYGTFPIWHRETNLQLMDLESGEIHTLDAVNSDRSDTYHSWSSSGKWFAFASKRGDGQYGRVYFAYIDKDGHAGKPFVLPQANPGHDDLNLKSYNIPELSASKVPFDAYAIQKLMNKTEVESFN